MKVTVTKHLNVRVGKPSLNAPCYQYLAPGSELEVDGKIYEGESYNGIDKWMKDEAENYYWTGGIEDSNLSTLPKDGLIPNNYFVRLRELINWNERISQIPDAWRKTKGEGVKIAILDTGVYSNHEDFMEAIISNEDFTVIKDKIDYSGHGTHVSGLIGARSTTINGVIGVAPSSKLICLKVLPDSKDGDDMHDYQSIIDALDMAVTKGADVINLSLSLSLKLQQEVISDDKMKIVALRNKIKEIGDKNIIIVAAGGDNADLRNQNLFFPAECPEVISVSSINEGYFIRNPVYSPKLNIVGPTINYLSTFTTPLYYERFGGCSMTTAFISGIIALAISFNKTQHSNRFSKNEILSMLNDYSIALEDIDYHNDAGFYFHILNQSS